MDLLAAKIECFNIVSLSKRLRLSRQGDFANLQNICSVGITQRDVGVLLGNQNGEPFSSDLVVLITLKISSTMMGESPIDGSSRSNSRGFAIKARPIAVICCSPPDVRPERLWRNAYQFRKPCIDAFEAVLYVAAVRSAR